MDVPLLGLLVFAALVTVGIIPLVMSVRVKTRSLRILSLLLGLFAVVHGFYHLSLALDYYYIGVVFLQPISIVFLVSFGLYYSKKGIP
ncbi:MAG TPA: hypothetical protein VFE98_06570 [Candidatus Bathyarchaeia archaeon]|nr:hypothetical protein [Candidatus Bathyarchaeia archaeon]